MIEKHGSDTVGGPTEEQIRRGMDVLQEPFVFSKIGPDLMVWSVDGHGHDFYDMVRKIYKAMECGK